MKRTIGGFKVTVKSFGELPPIARPTPTPPQTATPINGMGDRAPGLSGGDGSDAIRALTGQRQPRTS